MTLCDVCFLCMSCNFADTQRILLALCRGRLKNDRCFVDSNRSKNERVGGYDVKDTKVLRSGSLESASALLQSQQQNF